jgi:hypothetical protein
VDPGTRFIATVPAFMWLWRGHDVFLEHVRRYTLPRIERVPQAGPHRRTRVLYFYVGVLPLVAHSRVVERLRRPGHEAARRQLQEFGSLPNAMLWTACLADCQYFGQIAWRGSQSSFALRNKTRCRILKQRLIYRAFRPVGEMALTKIA